MDSIPDRLFANGRQPNQNFVDSECLYVRCNVNQIEGDYILPTQVIKFPNWSTNRQEYSEPEDVLLPKFLDWGIAKFRVMDIPKTLQFSADVIYQFKAVHVPTPTPIRPDDPPENYAHTEVRTFINGVYKAQEPSPSIKKEFRFQLSSRIKIFKKPSALPA
jgi:hypothetical protein